MLKINARQNLVIKLLISNFLLTKIKKSSIIKNTIAQDVQNSINTSNVLCKLVSCQ